MNLENKIAIVTGGARDIGRAISEKLAASGAKVVVNYFSSKADGAATVAAIEAAGGTAIAVSGDMTKPADVENLVKVTRKTFGDSIDILVNVAGGLGARKSLAEMDLEFFESIMRLNVSSAFLTSKSVTHTWVKAERSSIWRRLRVVMAADRAPLHTRRLKVRS